MGVVVSHSPWSSLLGCTPSCLCCLSCEVLTLPGIHLHSSGLPPCGPPSRPSATVAGGLCRGAASAERGSSREGSREALLIPGACDFLVPVGLPTVCSALRSMLEVVCPLRTHAPSSRAVHLHLGPDELHPTDRADLFTYLQLAGDDNRQCLLYAWHLPF